MGDNLIRELENQQVLLESQLAQADTSDESKRMLTQQIWTN